ncbi:MAG: hypothetical protein C4524_13470 [Candidatus Zixiibacteriota bacterium]|nr:MAG: hypothetical protein C4524_13470 [candidate division Zixibacteria bacterium]
MKRLPWLLALLCLAAPGWSVPLQQAFDQATPGAGYDRIVYLDQATLYTGGLTLSDGDYCLVSSGAVVDLEGNRIIVNPSASLDICGVVLANSDSAALKFSGAGHGWVDHVTFCANYDGLYFWQNSAMKITSCIIANSTRYGVYCHSEYDLRWMAYNDAWSNPSGNYREYCPS